MVRRPRRVLRQGRRSPLRRPRDLTTCPGAYTSCAPGSPSSARTGALMDDKTKPVTKPETKPETTHDDALDLGVVVGRFGLGFGLGYGLGLVVHECSCSGRGRAPRGARCVRPGAGG